MRAVAPQPVSSPNSKKCSVRSVGPIPHTSERYVSGRVNSASGTHMTAGDSCTCESTSFDARLLPWKVSLTLESTNSTIASTAAWNLLGLATEDFFATRQNMKQKTSPRKIDQNIESTLIVIALPAHWFR